jgi:hypothetical protein
MATLLDLQVLRDHTMSNRKQSTPLHHLRSHLWVRLRASSALHCLVASCGTSWACWAGWALVTLGVRQYLDDPMIGGSLRGVVWLSPTPIGCLWWVLCLPSEEPKGNSSKLLVSLSTLTFVCWFLWHPIVGLGLWMPISSLNHQVNGPHNGD